MTNLEIIQMAVESIENLGFYYGDDFETNIKQDFNAFPVAVLNQVSAVPSNLNALSDHGGVDADNYNIRLSVYVKGSNDKRGIQHAILQEQAYEYLKVIMYRLTKFDEFIGFVSANANFVKNKFDSYADGVESNIVCKFKNLTDYVCYDPTSV
jgi:hypothetical protein